MFTPSRQSYLPYVWRPPVSPSTSNWWLSGGISASNCIAAYQPKDAASLEASYINLANPGTYDLSLGVAPTWSSAVGWTGTATSYLKTGIVPPAGDMAWTIIVRFSSANDVGSPFGSRESATSSRFTLIPTSSTSRIYVHSASRSVSGNVANGVMAIANRETYLNGSSDGTIGAATGGTTWKELYILATNNNDASRTAFFNGGVIQAIAIYNAELSAAQISALTTAMNAL